MLKPGSRNFKRASILMVMVLLSSFLLFINPINVNATGNTYYVAQNGDDSRTPAAAQNISTPWQTINHAASLAQAGDTIIIRGGTYRETITPANSGTDGNTITYRAYPAETVTVSGAELITGTWTVDSDNKYKVSVTLPFKKGNNQIFINGSMANEARWPNQTSANILEPTWAEFDSASSDTSFYDAAMPDIDWTGAIVWINSNRRWCNWTSEVSSYSNRTISFSNIPEEPWAGIMDVDFDDEGGRFKRYYALMGAYGAMDITDEWYYNGIGTLYIYGNPAGKTIEYKARETAFDLSNKQYIVLNGINIRGARVKMDNSNYCVLDSITAKYISHMFAPYIGQGDHDAGTGHPAYYGINDGIYINGNGNEIKNSTVQYASQGLITVHGNNNRIVNNLLEYANYYTSFVPSSCTIDGNDNLISHNTMTYAGRACITPMGTHNVYQYNDISHGMMTTEDGGLVYVGNNTGGNSEFHHNWLHDCQKEGLYFDERSSYLLAFNNVVWNVGGAMFTPVGGFFNNGIAGYNIFCNNMISGKFTSNLYNHKCRLTDNVITGNADTASNLLKINNVSTGYNQYAFGTPGHNFINPPNPALLFQGNLYANKLENPSFENGSDDWTIVAGGVEASFSLDTAYYFSGCTTAKFTGNTGWIEKTVTGLQPNTTYELGAIVKSYDGGTVVMGVKDYGGNELQTESTYNDWAGAIISFTTGASNTSAKVYIKKVSGAGDARVDHMGLVFVQSSGTTVISDNFNSNITGGNPADWTLYGEPAGGSISVENSPAKSYKSMKILQQNNSTDVYTQKSFPAQSGNGITIEWEACAEQTDKWVSMYAANSDYTQVACAIAFGMNGKFMYSDGAANGGTWCDGPEYSANTWYAFKIVAETDTDKFDLYINGNLAAQNIDFHGTASNIGRMHFGGSVDHYTAAMYVDDLRVSRPPVYDNFNGNTTGTDPSGWAVYGDPSGGSISVENIPSYSDKSMKIYQQNGNEDVYALKSFPAQSGSGIVIEWKARAEQTNKWISMYAFNSDYSLAACAVAFGQNGKFFYSNGGYWGEGSDYSANTWYTFKIVANTDTDKFDLYINGSLAIPNISFHSATSDIGRMYFGGSASHYAATAYIDEFSVTRPAAYDSFNSNPTGGDPAEWAVYGDPSGGCVEIAEIPSSGDKSMKVYQQNNSTDVYALKSFSAQSGSDITIEWRARAEQINKWISMYVRNSEGTLVACALSFSMNGNFFYSDGLNWREGQNYTSGSWYTFKVVCNTDTDKYDLYINGSIVATNINFFNAVEDIGQMQFSGTAGHYPATAYFDEFKVDRP